MDTTQETIETLPKAKPELRPQPVPSTSRITAQQKISDHHVTAGKPTMVPTPVIKQFHTKSVPILKPCTLGRQRKSVLLDVTENNEKTVTSNKTDT